MIYHCIVYVPLIWTGHEQKEHILSNINSLKQMISYVHIWHGCQKLGTKIIFLALKVLKMKNNETI